MRLAAANTARISPSPLQLSSASNDYDIDIIALGGGGGGGGGGGVGAPFRITYTHIPSQVPRYSSVASVLS
jgi:hypothetical protein